MSFHMVMYGAEYKDDEIHLKELVSWKNHYLLDNWFTNKCIEGNSTEGLFIPIEDAIYDLEEDCIEAIEFLKDHVTEYRLHISEDETLVDEWEYKWDAEIPPNPFFKHNFRFYLGRYGVDGFINYLEIIIEFIKKYKDMYEVFMYHII